MCKRSFLAILQHLKVGSHLEQETPRLEVGKGGEK